MPKSQEKSRDERCREVVLGFVQEDELFLARVRGTARIRLGLLFRYGREISGLWRNAYSEGFSGFLRLITFPCSFRNVHFEERSFKLVDIELIILI